jgi:hypothetical protein
MQPFFSMNMRRLKAWPWLGAALLLIILSASAVCAESGKVIIRKESGPAGHETIGLDEKSLTGQTGQGIKLTFKKLMKWNYEVGQNTPAPAAIKRLHDKLINITGFMYPLQQGKSIQFFCIMRTTQTCCYGPRPQYNQFIFVEAEKPTRFHRLAPVRCIGRFKVEPSPDDGYIYRLEGLACQKKAVQ